MSDDEPPKQAFSFRFTNPVQDSGEPLVNLLYIQETPRDRDLLTVEATPLKDVTFTLLTPSSTTPSRTNHHFSLTFTLGTLAQPASIRLSGDAASQWAMVHEVQEPTRVVPVRRPSQRGRCRRGLQHGARGARGARAPVHPGDVCSCA